MQNVDHASGPSEVHARVCTMHEVNSIFDFEQLSDECSSFPTEGTTNIEIHAGTPEDLEGPVTNTPESESKVPEGDALCWFVANSNISTLQQ